MFIAIILILMSFMWLMAETNFLRIQLPSGETPEPFTHPRRKPLLEPCVTKTLSYPKTLLLSAPRILLLTAPKILSAKVETKIKTEKTYKKQKLVVLADRDYRGKANRKISAVRREMNLNDILDEVLDANY